MKTAIVTGAAGNLGQAIVKKFLAEGYHVTGSVTRKEELSMLTHAAFQAVQADLSDETDANRLVEEAVKRNAGVDAAILTVGGFAMGKITDTPASDMEKQWQLNFMTTYNVARPVFTQMLRQGSGHLFLTASRPGSDMRVATGMTAYALSKSLIFRLAELMNEEAKGSGVVTTVIVPSTIDTPQNRAAMPQADPAKWVKPEEIADIIHSYCLPTAAVLREPVLHIYNNS